MHNNYMLADLWVMIKAIVVFPLFVLAPGFVAGWASNVLEFRHRRTLTQLALSTPLSIAIFPIVTFWLGRFGGFPAIWAAYGLIWLGFLAIIGLNWRSINLRPANRAEQWAWGAIAIWVLSAIGSLMHLQFSDKFYYNNAAFDYCVRSAFTASIMRGFPPSNPFFTAFGAIPLRYHYFWMLICALPAKLLKGSPMLVMYGGTVWVGIALVSSIALYVRFVLGETRGYAEKALLGGGLLLVTGLDLAPTAYVYFTQHQLLVDPEWWNEVQVTSWVDSMLWVPHYLASLIAGLMALLFLLQAAKMEGNRRYAPVILAGLAFASATGLGIYVALVFVVFCLLWVLLSMARNGMHDAALVLAAGVVAIVAALPFLAILRGSGGATAAGVAAGAASLPLVGEFAQLTIRPFTLVNLAVPGSKPGNVGLLHVVDLVVLPFYYLIEFGFFFIVGVLRWRGIRKSKKKFSREELACWTLLVASLLVGSFVTSTSISSNDLGMRSMLPAQFVLLLFAVPIVHKLWLEGNGDGLTKNLRTLLTVTACLGVLMTAYQVVLLRSMFIVADNAPKLASLFGEADGTFGFRVLATREAFEALKGQFPPTAVVQANPSTPEYAPLWMFDNYPAAAGLGDCGVGFGGDSAKCKQAVTTYLRLFEHPGPQDGEYVDRICSAFSTDALVVSNNDPVWQVQTWVWSRPVMFANDYVRVFRCGGQASTAKEAP